MSSDESRAIGFEELQAERERVKDGLPGPLRHRTRRAISWVGRAEKEAEDDDAAFVFYWIAFNAAYARERSDSSDSTERDRFAEYFDTLLSLDSANTIYDAIWERFSGPIRLLLDNRYVFRPFWDHHAGLRGDDWEPAFERSKRLVRRALSSRDTRFILSTLFDRLYVLRNQIMHGGATWRGKVNRAQVGDGAEIMRFLVPLFVSLMMSRPDIDWGPPDYPVVD